MQTRKQNSKTHRKTIRHRKGGNQKSPKNMNCSPIVEGSTATQTTCYTPEVLKQIRDSYNQNHPKEMITTDDLNQIWQELKNRLSHCKKEDCWLKEIRNTQMQKHLDEYIFAPDHPPEWKNSPNEWLSNIDILKVLQQYEKKVPTFQFIGPTPIDFDSRPKEEGGKCVWEDLCHFDLAKSIQKGKRHFGIVFNLDTHEKSGSHWVSLFISVHPETASKERSFAFFFDSAGSPAPREVKQLISRVKEQWHALYPHLPTVRFIQNAPHTHQYSNTECGMYSLIFIITMLTGKPLNQSNPKGGSNKQILSVSQRIALFKRGNITDKHAEMYRDLYFNSS
jgi:hypothetical protein